MTTATVEIDWEDCEPSYEEGGGYPIALYYDGHPDLDAVERAGRRYYDEMHDGDSGQLCERPRHIYLRKVPSFDEYGGRWMLHCEKRKPGRGAKAVTVFTWLNPWALIPCEGGPAIRCSGPTCVAYPVAVVKDPKPDAKQVHFCKAHGDDFNERLRAARYDAAQEAARG